MRSAVQAAPKHGALFIAAVLAIAAVPRPIRADVVVVAPDQPPATVLAGDEDKASKLCASSLAEYLKKITGQEFPVAYGKTTAQRVIEVVTVDPDAEPRLGKEAFIIEAAGNRVRLIGGSDQSRLYAVFEFLRLYGQARWWSRNEEDIPSLAKIAVPEGRQVIRPTFAQYMQVNKEAEYSFKPVAPGEKNIFSFKLRTQSTLRYTGGHNLYPLLNSYGSSHPEIYPMDKEGQRGPNKLHFCYMADGIAEALAAALAREVEKREGNITDWVYFAGMGDWYGGMCQCPRCKPVYEEETWTDPDGHRKPGYSATLLRMLNKTAGILKQKYPGIMLGTQAYMSLEAPPAKTKPADNLIILIPRLRHVTVRSVLEADELVAPQEIDGPSQNVELTEEPASQPHVKASNRSFRRNLEQWLKLAPGRVRIWDYAASFNNFLMPFPCLRAMAENIKFYRTMGVTGLLLQGSYSGTGSDMIVLKNHVLGRLLWDANADTQALIKEFCDGYYGPAAAEAYAYVNALEDSVRRPVPINMSEWDDPLKLLTPALLDQLEAILKPGVGKCAAADAKYLRRIKELAASLEVARLWFPGPLVERNGVLVRDDLKGDTLARAQDLVKHIRNGTPKEWGIGPRYQQMFISWHGGPVHTLSQGPLTVKVAPMQTGRAGPVFYKDAEVIRQTYDCPEGSSYRVTGKVQPRQIELESDFGMNSWMEIAPWLNHRTIEIQGDDALSIAGTLRKAPGAKNNATCTPKIGTDYPVNNAKDLTVEYAGPDGVFKPVALALGGRKKVEITGLQKLRVTLVASKRRVTDQYLTGNNTAIATVELMKKDKGDCVRITVTLPDVDVDAEQMRAYEDRKLLFE